MHDFERDLGARTGAGKCGSCVRVAQRRDDPIERPPHRRGEFAADRLSGGPAKS